jgi:hypothetical protein
LCVVARAKDKDSRPNFEAHNITRLYDEFNQAARGTRWVWTMTCASCAEGLVKLLEPRSQPRSDADHEAIDDIIKHVGSWPGHDRFAKDEVRRLKEAATRALRNAGMTTTALNLKNLVASGAVTREQFDAWDAIRNRVMHGNLISPYARDEDETNMLLELAGLMHTLTLEILRRSPDSG